MKDGCQLDVEKLSLVDLWVFIEDNNLPGLNNLINIGVDVNTYSFQLHCSEAFPLLYAIRLGRVEIARALILAGACVETLFIGSNPLHDCIFYGQTEIALTLIAKGAKKEILHDDMTPLHHAIALGEKDIALALIENGADVEVLYAGMSPLHHAIKAGSFEIVIALIAAGANKEAVCLGMTPLLYAIYYEITSIACFLIKKGANIEAMYKDATAFDMAVFNDLDEVKQTLRDAGADIGDFKQDWVFNLERHYKCWFSKNPDEFLDVENQLRLIKLTTKNPQISLTLIYSSKCLNSNAIKELFSFCHANNIIPLDFDTEVKNIIADTNDEELYELAEEEIKRTISDEGGNFAGASDIIRLILAIIEKGGMYNDFEKPFYIEPYSPFIKCSVPIMINSKYKEKHINNDTIAAAVENSNSSKLDKTAIQMIRNAQAQLLSNYRDYAKAILTSVYLTKFNKFTSSVITAYIKKFPNSTVFDFRKFAQNANTLQIMDLVRTLISNSREITQKELDTLKQRLLKISVVAISGPEVMNGFFQKRFVKYIPHCGLNQNMKNVFIDAQSDDNPCVQRKEGFDLSWIPSGASKKMKSSESIKKDIITIQSICRGSLSRHHR